MSFSRCGICKLAPRVDDQGGCVRLHPDDLAGDDLDSAGGPIAPGLYQCCRDCEAKYAPRVEARLRRTPAVGDDSAFPPRRPDGSPAMTLEPGRPMTRRMLM